MSVEIADLSAEYPANRNSMICPCCLQFVEGAEFLADPVNCQITNGSASVRLSRQQFNVARYLIDCFPLMAERDRIYDHVFLDVHGEGPGLKIVDVIVCKIRPALADIGMVVETVWGKGYKIVMADARDGNAIKDASVRLRAPGAMKRWAPEHDAQLKELIGRKYKIAACASIMKMPYMAVERHYKRVQQDGASQ